MEGVGRAPRKGITDMASGGNGGENGRNQQSIKGGGKLWNDDCLLTPIKWGRGLNHYKEYYKA